MWKKPRWQDDTICKWTNIRQIYPGEKFFIIKSKD